MWYKTKVQRHTLTPIMHCVMGTMIVVDRRVQLYAVVSCAIKYNKPISNFKICETGIKLQAMWSL